MGVSKHRYIYAQRNESNANESSQCPVDLLQKADSQELNIWLSRFVTEVRKQPDGKPVTKNFDPPKLVPRGPYISK